MCKIVYIINNCMMKKNIVGIFVVWLVSTLFAFISPVVLAQDSDLEVDGFNIIPKLDSGQVDKAEKAIKEVWQTGWKVMDTYNQKAGELKTSEQIATWIMNRDTIINYLVFVVQFISQLWITIWVIFIMYAWYQYMLSVFKWWKAPSDMVKNAIIWVIIVIFSYAILKTLTSLIWIS